MTWSPKESKPNKAQGRGTSEMQDLLKEISILYSFVTSLYIKAFVLHHRISQTSSLSGLKNELAVTLPLRNCVRRFSPGLGVSDGLGSSESATASGLLVVRVDEDGVSSSFLLSSMAIEALDSRPS